MKEVIESIKSTQWESSEANGWRFEMEGYIIKTNKQEIKIGISSGQSCCENAGFFSVQEKLEDFVGATITGIKLTDQELHTKLMKERFEYGLDEGGIQFVDIETDRGALQIAVYNSHNGYYGHSIEIVSEQLKHTGGL